MSILTLSILHNSWHIFDIKKNVRMKQISIYKPPSFCCCSVTKLCPALCKPMDCSILGSPVLRYLQILQMLLLRCRSIESVMLSNHLILCHPLFLLLQSFPASGSLPAFVNPPSFHHVLESLIPMVYLPEGI